MSFRRAVNLTGISTLLFATAALIATGCSSGSSASGTGGATGTGGKGTGGKTGAGGATGSGGSGAGGSAAMPNCTPLPADPNMPVLFDFADMTSTNFGDFSTALSGTLFMFNGSAPNVSTGAWVIDQDVTGYGDAGATLSIAVCPKADLSAFTGIAFDIAGTISPPQMAGLDGGTLPSQVLTLQVGTVPDDVASNYDAQNQFAPSFGTCVPTTGNQYDGSCASPQASVTFAAGPTLVTKSFLWNQITGGKGQPGGRSTPDPAQITRFSWIFPFNGVSPFHINLTIDNIRLLTGGTTTDAGTDTTPPPPPADAAPDTATD